MSMVVCPPKRGASAFLLDQMEKGSVLVVALLATSTGGEAFSILRAFQGSEFLRQ